MKPLKSAEEMIHERWNSVTGFIFFQDKTKSVKRRIKDLEAQKQTLAEELQWQRQRLAIHQERACEFAQQLLELGISPKAVIAYEEKQRKN